MEEPGTESAVSAGARGSPAGGNTADAVHGIASDQKPPQEGEPPSRRAGVAVKIRGSDCANGRRRCGWGGGGRGNRRKRHARRAGDDGRFFKLLRIFRGAVAGGGSCRLLFLAAAAVTGRCGFLRLPQRAAACGVRDGDREQRGEQAAEKVHGDDADWMIPQEDYSVIGPLARRRLSRFSGGRPFVRGGEADRPMD